MPKIGSPSGVQWEIEFGDQRAVIVEVGGGLRSYTSAGAEVVDGYALDELCPGSAGQVLQPWPNRVRDGKFSFGGVDQQLTLSEPALHNAIHGLTRWLTWHATAQSAESVTVECDLPAQPGYPWPLRLVTTWTLGPDGLCVDHEATNVGGAACPFGLGVHPYLHIEGVAVDDLRLTLPAHSRLLVDGRLLPMGEAKVAGGPFDFSEGRRIGDARMDTAFGDVRPEDDGLLHARLETADGSRARELWADGAFHWLQAYTGDTLHGERVRRSVAIEPMTCPPDAFRSGRDVVTIEPGESWRGSWGLRAIGV
ncbi:MAG TPA: aldose 1-epimerase family protein [Micromonosporaceae bacterium]|jgi:aldose 1-epimerase